MKRISILFCAMVMSFIYVGHVNATLIQYSPLVVQDDRGTVSALDDLFFFRDLSRFSDMDYAAQLASISLLNTELDGLGPWGNNWHLASGDEMSNLFSDFVSVPDVFLNSGGADSYIGRYEEIPLPDKHLVYEVLVTGGFPPITHELYGALDSSASPTLGAWAVANYRGEVPEGSALYLFAIGFFGLIAIRRRGIIYRAE